ncbi:HAD family hydrolase [Intrasporangium calvum]|uniref:HAD family hydrolase n=1 Tax=Intrasporangium calvum TaxID=53358 RepID=A0ABT5GEI0_9MICO|nr:HAD family hydrolase [Intrasporangium calvum]MDC5696659.1 HAD family hydrolase [Intrasporangium calvum]
MRGRADQNPRADELLTKLRRRAEAGVGAAGRPATADSTAAGVAIAPPLRVISAIGLALAVLALALWAGDHSLGRWIQVLLTSAIVGWCARRPLESAWASVRRRRPNPDVPVLLGVVIAWVATVVDVARDAPDVWFGTPATAAALLLLVHHLEQRTRTAAGPAGPAPRSVQRLEAWFGPGVVLVAAIVLAVRLVTGQSLVASLQVAVAVLLVASFPAAALAAPTVLAAARARATRRLGLADADALATAAALDTVVINRTDVLTTGDLSLHKIAVTGRLSKQAALTAAAAVEQGSDHPVARAIVAGARLARIDLPRIREFQADPGEGASAVIKDTEVTVGKAALFERLDRSLLAHADQTPGHTVFVGWGGRARAALTVQDTVRDGAGPAVRRLKDLGLTTYLVGEDGEAQARGVAAAAGIDPGKVRSAPGPGDVDLVTELERQGRRVAVIGRTEGEPLFAHGDLDRVADTVALAQQAHAVTRQHVGWALGYNAVALVAAGFGLVEPAWSATLATVAALVPLASAQRLRS